MNNSVQGTLSDFIKIQSNWTRSVNVERDAAEWADGSTHYTLTPMTRTILEQAVSGIQDAKGTRTWTITGPYGTGKSAFALALTRFLCLEGPSSGLHMNLKAEDPVLASRLEQVWAQGPRFLPVLVNGRRAPLIPALATGLRRALQSGPHSLKGRRALLTRLDELDPNDAVGLTALYERAAQSAGGILLIIDELGKFLEYVAQRPDRSDVFVLQLLAEAAARSAGTPVLVFGILHHSFLRYGAQLTKAQRDEFSKVQGRFQDIAFNHSHDLMLRLVGKSLQGNSRGATASQIRLQTQVGELAARVIAGRLGLSGVDRDEAVALLTRCAPIHPITALILGPLFRRLAQNERSLFSFLSSHEAFGLREFLQHTSSSVEPTPLYTPDVLCDYVMSALGTALYQDVSGRRWAQIGETLDRLRDGSSLEVRLVKTVGILTAIGDMGNIRPAADVIKLCFAESDAAVEATLRRLVEKKVLVYRSFADAYRLWEGSDLDLEERLNVARSFVDDAKGLDELLTATAPSRPLVARRHSLETGTLRFFEVAYVSYGNWPTMLRAGPTGEADGRLLYVLVDSISQEAELEALLISDECQVDELTVVVPLRVPVALHGAALELERLRWVEVHTPELSGDLVAQRELRSRLHETERILKRELEYAMSSRETELRCLWNRQSHRVQGMRELNQYLSYVYDRVYHKTPVIQNELINRRQLSSAASAARRLLMEGMLERSELPNLGIEGYPPQLSMYFSLLADTGLHRLGPAGAWELAPPAAEHSLAYVWGVWRDFLDGCRQHRRSLAHLWNQLKRPPLGLRDGVIPVLILAMLRERRAEVGIYESNTFVPDLTVPHLERFIRNPEKFEIRYCPIDGFRLEVFSELSRVLGGRAERSLVPLVRALIRNVAKLPPYAQKTTAVSAKAQAVRAALLSAKEPDVLLFKDLPQALGYASLLDENVQADAVAPFVQDLVGAIRDLNAAYRLLLEKLFSLLVWALELPVGQQAALGELKRRVAVLRNGSVDLRLKGFIDHLEPPAVLELFDSWIESLGSFVASRPPSSWGDSDLTRFEAELAVLSRKLKHLEDVAFQLGQFADVGDVDAVRFGLTAPSGEEVHKVVFLAEIEHLSIPDLETELDSVFQDFQILTEEGQLAALVLLARRRLLRKASS